MIAWEISSSLFDGPYSSTINFSPLKYLLKYEQLNLSSSIGYLFMRIFDWIKTREEVRYFIKHLFEDIVFSSDFVEIEKVSHYWKKLSGFDEFDV